MRTFLMIAALVMMMANIARAETITATVDGLVCSFCAAGIEKTFQKQAAVEHVKVDMDTKKVTIHTKADQTLDDAAVTKFIQDSGFTVTEITREK